MFTKMSNNLKKKIFNKTLICKDNQNKKIKIFYSLKIKTY